MKKRESKKVKNTEPGQGKRVVKQVTFEPDEWELIKDDMEKEKIDEISLYIRRSLLLRIGKTIQERIRFPDKK
jgi:hypothetical protein